MSLNKDMGDRHEEYVATVLGQRQSRGSGNQWRDPIDSRHNRLDTEWAFASDCKSTLKKSISVSLTTWKKAVEQAGGERPSLPLRLYADASLSRVSADLIAVDLLDFAGMRESALLWEKAAPVLRDIVAKQPRCMPVLVELLQQLLDEADGR